MRYTKQQCTQDELIALLSNRGLRINSTKLAKKILTNVGYTTFNSYCFPFFLQGTHSFRPGTSLSSVWSVYLLDQRLRILLFPCLLLVEQALKTRWAEFITQLDGPFGYLNASLFSSESVHQQLM